MITRTPAGIPAELWEEITSDLNPASSTVNDYRKVLNLLHAAEYGNYHILTMTTEDAAEYFRFLDQRVKNGDLSSNTAHRYKATLRSLGRRIEGCGSCQDYKSPFSGLMKNEKRLRTAYTEDMFVSKETVLEILDVLSSFSERDRAIAELMIYIGLTPAQIQNLRVCDFKTLEDGSLSMILDMGTFLENTRKPWNESDLYLAGEPVTYVRDSARGITWRYTGTLILSPKISDVLLSRNPTLGSNQDTRRFFMTNRHHEYSYRALHHLVHEICNKAEISETVTPNQLSLTGIVNNWYMHQENNPELTHWLKMPVPLETTIRNMQEQLSEDFLKSLCLAPYDQNKTGSL